jgi:mono/diheme cytochrome c family protein
MTAVDDILAQIPMSQLAARLGVDERTAEQATRSALPALLGGKQRTADEIRGWLADPHPPMPNLNLSRQEIDDILAYLESLTGD